MKQGEKKGPASQGMDMVQAREKAREIKRAKSLVERKCMEPLEMLKEGNARFLEKTSKSELGELAKGQKPFAAVVYCSDSRVDAGRIFDVPLGKIFGVEAAGNVAVDKMAVASIEYAVLHLGVRLLVVLGHSHCGAVKAAIGGHGDTENISALIHEISPAVEKAGKGGEAGLELRAVEENARLQLKNILEKSSALRERAGKGELKAVAGVYELETGAVRFL